MKRLLGRLKYVALFAIFALLIGSVRSNLSDIRDVMDINIAGDARLGEAARMQVEFQDFILKAGQFVDNDPHIEKADVTLAFDILWSRIDTLGSAKDYEIVQHLDRRNIFFNEIKTAMQVVDPHVQALVRGDRKGLDLIDSRLMALSPDVADFAQAASEMNLSKTLDTAERQRAATLKIRTMQRAFLGLSLLTLILLSGEIVRVRRWNREIKSREAMIIQIGLVDALTGLNNRRFLVQYLDALPNGTEVTLLMLDMDGFKAVNDTYGHPIGDELLKQVAGRLTALAPEGTVVTRLGGDEFALASIMDISKSTRLASDIIDELEKNFEIEGRAINISSSIGLACANSSDKTASIALLGDADVALYEAKNAGRGCFRIYDIVQRQKQNYRNAIEDSLSAAIDNGNISVFYHPQIDLATKCVVGVEALCRWHHPEHGNIPPEQFIKAAEQTGLIRKLDLFVLETACREIKVLSRAGIDLRLAVNISPVEAGRRGYAHELLAAIDRLKFPRERLTLELTENAVMEDFSVVERNLKILVDAGIGIAIDDFGAGYSNLSYLARFPFTYLKVDRNLANDLVTSAKDRTILEAIVRLAKGLNLQVIMEGIESQEQLTFIQSIGVPEAQGFFFAEPLSDERLIPFLSTFAMRQKQSAKRKKVAA